MGGGCNSGDLKGVQRLRVPPQDVTVLQIPEESAIGGEWWLAGSDSKPDKGAGDLAENVEDTDQGGGEAMGVQIFL